MLKSCALNTSSSSLASRRNAARASKICGRRRRAGRCGWHGPGPAARKRAGQGQPCDRSVALRLKAARLPAAAHLPLLQRVQVALRLLALLPLLNRPLNLLHPARGGAKGQGESTVRPSAHAEAGQGRQL